ncbi:non-specific serine/threonine protein kinase/serine/threonine-protein kinase [Sphingopyxis panaciterrae]|uniref:serine/threonine-protein kinase n=1 Tax=Sphingopyxis panaciterrae TaxID=363841 RepID=UPI00141E2B70|nr:serine/threonine-protein kinase [Sphingopyxis panaciterrae]NIJ37180.1 non-specific serine/threonine protein kinase/serine/threonine-protein kinase [Sphingopyxis panaciterrae]
MEAFDTLTDLTPAARSARLARLDLEPLLADRLRAMLAAEGGEGLLDAGLTAGAEAETPPEYASLDPGTVVGGFRVERLIGRGGMGEVYLAHRDGADFDQRAALKLLRPEAAERFGLFSAERRMLAGLEHPSIARLIDGGVAPDGRPYMLMDYIEGQEINRWCAAHRADLPTRLGLFLELCDAVAYAHARLVIHRDIKPANILVDASGRGHLLDFGVARLLDTREETRPVTDAGLTPQYAAPEQIEGGEITVATDIYALGALLYELLAGHGPWQLGGDAPLPTVLRRMLYEEPRPPSEAVDESGKPVRIASDLDAIVMKALRREPGQRYSSVEAFAADIRRFQACLPVEARAGALGYRIRRYLRRNRWGVAAASLIIGALLAGGIGIAWQAQRAAAERDAAMAQAERAEAVNQAMMLMFREASDRGQADSITARALIDSTASRMVGSLDPDDGKSSAIIAALSDLYILTENLPASQALLENALARGIGRNDPPGASRLKLKLAQAYGATRRFDEARRLLKEARAVWVAAPDRYRVERVEAASAEAYMLRLEGKADAGIALLMETMPEAEQAYATNSRDLATRTANLATHLVMANRINEAEKVIDRAETLLSRSDAMRSPAGLTLEKLRASILARRGDIAGAEALFGKAAAMRRELYGPSYSLAVDLLQHGRMLNQLGRPAEALKSIDEARTMAVTNFGPKGSLLQLIDLARAEALLRLDRNSEAQAVLIEVEPKIREYGRQSAENGALLLVRSQIDARNGRRAAAAAVLDEAQAIFRALGPAGAGYLQSVDALRREEP